MIPIHSWRQFWQVVVDQWGEDMVTFVHDRLPKIITILVVAFILTRLVKLVSQRLTRLSQRQELPSGLRAQQLRTLASVIYSIGFFIVVFLAGMQILQQLDVNIGPLLASAGIVGLAIGFGAQTLVKDVINGFFILVENHFDIGDWVKIGSVQGTVELMTLRRTVLRDGDGTVHTIPNSTITVVSNTTRDWTQLILHVEVDYRADSDRVVELLKQIAAEVRAEEAFKELIVSEPQVPGIERVTANAVEFLVLVKTWPGQQYGVARELRRRIKQTFEQQGIAPGGRNRVYVVDEAEPPQEK